MTIPSALLYDLDACDDVVGTLFALEKWKRRRKATRGDPPRPVAGAVLWDTCFETLPRFRLDDAGTKSGPNTEVWEESDSNRRGSALGIDMTPRLRMSGGMPVPGVPMIDFYAGGRYARKHYSRIYRMIGEEYLPECPDRWRADKDGPAEWANCTLRDAAYCGRDLTVEEVIATRDHRAAYLARFGPTTLLGAAGHSSAAGRPGARWGWLIYRVNFAWFQMLAHLPTPGRELAIHQLRSLAMETLNDSPAVWQAMREIIARSEYIDRPPYRRANPGVADPLDRL